MGIQSGRWLSRHRIHSLVTLTLAAGLLAVGGLVATGVLGGLTPAPPLTAPLPTPAGSTELVAPWVRPALNADFLPHLSQKIEVFEYNGPPVSAWIEVEMDGQRTRLGGGAAGVRLDQGSGFAGRCRIVRVHPLGSLEVGGAGGLAAGDRCSRQGWESCSVDRRRRPSSTRVGSIAILRRCFRRQRLPHT